MSKKKKDWKTEKERLLNMDVEDRRREYRRSEYVSLEKILTWRQTCKDELEGKDLLCDKVSLYKGDITILEVDAIVNAANSSLLGGGGVDGCIHKAAGSCLFDECQTLRGCETGKAKITCGYDLPSKYVIHTVGPVARDHVGKTETSNLTACYQNSLKLVKENGLRTVAFPCISTGIYGFPNEPAAEIALNTVKAWIKENYDQITRVIFCVFLETDYKIYKEKISHVFQGNEETDVVIKGPQSEDEGNPAKEDTEESKGPEDQAEDVEMESQREDTDMEANKNDENEDVNVPTKAEEGLPAASQGTEDADNAPAELEQSQTMEMTSEAETFTPNDEAPEARRSSASSDVDLKAQADDSQGSDLTQTDTQSKEPEDMK